MTPGPDANPLPAPPPPRPAEALTACGAAGLVALAALLLAYLAAPPFFVRPSRQDAVVFRDFHQARARGRSVVRYSHVVSGEKRPRRARQEPSVIALPQIGRPDEGVLELQLSVPREAGAVPLTLTVNGRRLQPVPVRDRRSLALRVDQRELAAGDLRVRLEGPAWNPPEKKARLGVGVERVAWRPLSPSRPPPRQTWALPGLAAALCLLLLRFGARPAPAALAGGAAGAVLAAVAALRPLELAPYTHRLLLAVLLAHAALLLFSLVAGHGARLPQALGMRELLVLMGIAYWMPLLFQRALSLEAGPQLAPRASSDAIGLAVLGLLLLAAALPRLRRFALGVVALGGLAEGVAAAAFALHRPGLDFGLLWRAARDQILGRPLYDIPSIVRSPFGDIFKVPPFYALMLVPLGLLSRGQALLTRRVLDLVFYLVVAVLLARVLRPRVGGALALATLLVVMGSMQPPFDTLAYGQADVLLLLLLTVALVAARAQRDWLAGLGIAAGTLCKIYPALAGGFLLGRRMWRAVLWTGAWFVLLNAVSGLALGFGTLVQYWTQVVPLIGGGTSWVENQALHGFLDRLLTGHLSLLPAEEPIVNVLTNLGFVVGTATAVLLAARPAARGSAREAVQFGLFPVAMVLFGPNAWMHYQTIVVLAFVALVWHAAERPFGAGEAAALAAAFALIAFGNQWSFFDGERAPGLPALALSYKFYGLSLLWGVMLSRLLGRDAPAPAPA